VVNITPGAIRIIIGISAVVVLLIDEIHRSMRSDSIPTLTLIVFALDLCEPNTSTEINTQSIVIRKTSFARNFSLSFLIFTMFYVTVIIPISGIGSVAPRPIGIIIGITTVIMV